MGLYIIIFVLVVGAILLWNGIKGLSDRASADLGRGVKPVRRRPIVAVTEYIFRKPVIVITEDMQWVADFCSIDAKELYRIEADATACYNSFKLRKRSGGYRTISAPQVPLLSIQTIIYRRILVPMHVHPLAMGFRPKVSVVDNAKVHLGKKCVLKVDIHDFFGSVRIDRVMSTFTSIGYPKGVAKIFARLCCCYGRLPQGAPTSPALSNIIAYDMDKKLVELAAKYNLSYSRYADDLTFSGDEFPKETVLAELADVVKSEGFELNKKKTQYITEKQRKIITGVSISSGDKPTIPKGKKREMRKNIHYILTKGLVEHQRFIKSTDPLYLRRMIGYLNFWLSVEPENKYVIDSLVALRKLEKG